MRAPQSLHHILWRLVLIDLGALLARIEVPYAVGYIQLPVIKLLKFLYVSDSWFYFIHLNLSAPSSV